MSTATSPLASAVGSQSQDQTPDAPQVQMPVQAPPSNITQETPQMPTLAKQPGTGPRLLSTLASIVSAGIAGIPSQGRPSFVTGLGQGARAEQAVQAQQQEIKFRNFDDQIRAAQLHNQDLALQSHIQEQQDAHEAHMQAMHANDADWGIEYDSVPNNSEAVIDHLKTQTAANGSVSVPPGTHISGDGNSILIPKDTPETAAGQLAQFNAVAPALGLNITIPSGATKLDPKVATVFYNKLQGFDPTGEPYTADKLPALIASNQQRLGELTKQGAPQVQIDAVNGIIKKQQAQLKADNDALDKASQRKIAENKATQENRAQATEEINSAKPQKPTDNTELNSVAYDPNYQNADGTKGANVVMNKNDAAAQGLTHYKADPSTLNTTIAGFNDVQNKINQLAAITNDSKQMSQVQPAIAAELLEHKYGFTLSAFGSNVDMSRVNSTLYAEDVKAANPATRAYVTAMYSAHEAITQLPRLQTFGKSNRMTQQQMEAAQNLLPRPGDDAELAASKMTSLQGMLDPLRKQVPHMPGAETIPSWREKQQQTQRQAPSRLNPTQSSNLAQFVTGLK